MIRKYLIQLPFGVERFMIVFPNGWMNVLFFIMLGMACRSPAQVVEVADGFSGAILPRTMVLVQDQKECRYTDSLGRVDLSGWGGQDVQFIHLGYDTLRMAFEAIEQAGWDVFLIPREILLEPLVISASARDEKGGPMALLRRTISLEHVALYQPQTAADMLSLSGHVFIQKSQQGGAAR